MTYLNIYGLDTKIVLYTLLQEYISSEIGDDPYDMYMKLNTIYKLFNNINITYYYPHNNRELYAYKINFIINIHTQQHSSAIYVDIINNEFIYINSGLEVNLHKKINNSYNVFKKYKYNGQESFHICIDLFIKYMNTKKPLFIEDIHKLLYFCCNKKDIIDPNKNISDKSTIEYNLKWDKTNRQNIINILEYNIKNKDRNFIINHSNTIEDIVNNIPLQIAGTCTYYSLIYSHIYNEYIISKKKTDITELYKQVKQNIYDITNKNLNVAIDVLLSDNDYEEIQHIDIHILKMLYRKYENEKMLRVIINYYDNYKITSNNYNIDINNNFKLNNATIVLSNHINIPKLIYGIYNNESIIETKLIFMDGYDFNKYDSINNNINTKYLINIINNKDKKDILFYVNELLSINDTKSFKIYHDIIYKDAFNYNIDENTVLTYIKNKLYVNNKYKFINYDENIFKKIYEDIIDKINNTITKYDNNEKPNVYDEIMNLMNHINNIKKTEEFDISTNINIFADNYLIFIYYKLFIYNLFNEINSISIEDNFEFELDINEEYILSCNNQLMIEMTDMCDKYKYYIKYNNKYLKNITKNYTKFTKRMFIMTLFYYFTNQNIITYDDYEDNYTLNYIKMYYDNEKDISDMNQIMNYYINYNYKERLKPVVPYQSIYTKNISNNNTVNNIYETNIKYELQFSNYNYYKHRINLDAYNLFITKIKDDIINNREIKYNILLGVFFQIIDDGLELDTNIEYIITNHFDKKRIFLIKVNHQIYMILKNGIN